MVHLFETESYLRDRVRDGIFSVQYLKKMDTAGKFLGYYDRMVDVTSGEREGNSEKPAVK